MKQLLKSRRITQSALAAGLGVSEPTVSNWVAGRTRIPAERVLEIEQITGIGRGVLRPDLYPSASEAA